MNLVIKGSASIRVDMTDSGKICLEQLDDTIGEPAFVYLTLEQFRAVEKWVADNYLDIVEAWNSGVQ